MTTDLKVHYYLLFGLINDLLILLAHFMLLKISQDQHMFLGITKLVLKF